MDKETFNKALNLDITIRRLKEQFEKDNEQLNEYKDESEIKVCGMHVDGDAKDEIIMILEYVKKGVTNGS